MLHLTEALPISPVKPGATLSFLPPRGRRGLGCWVARPETIAPDLPPLVAIHGLYRGAETQAELWSERAAGEGRLVIAPEFDAGIWPRYQQVVRGRRADLALLALLDDPRLTTLCRTDRIVLTGYSGGAQFAHRFALLYPHRIVRLGLLAAGWYTFPDDAPFPYGFAARGGRGLDWGAAMSAGLPELLRRPVTVAVGAQDDAVDENTRSGEGIDAQQGLTRVDRAQAWASAMATAARQRDLSPRTDLRILPGCGHDFRDCMMRGGFGRILLGGDPIAAAPTA